MTTQNKVVAILLAIVGIVAVVFMLLGIIGVWWLAGTVNSAAVTVLSAVENGAQQSGELLIKVDTSVGSVQSDVNAIETRVTAVGVNISENPVILNALKQQYDERASPQMRTLVQSARMARSAIDRTASVAAAANSNPLTAMLTPDFSRVQTLDAALDEAEQELIRVGMEIRDLKVDATQAVTGGITGRLQKIDNALQVARDAVNEVNEKVTGLAARAAALQQSIPFWVNVSALGITLVMLAAVVGGIALAWSSITYLQSGGARMNTFLGWFSANAS
jgi:hypothetical protein